MVSVIVSRRLLPLRRKFSEQGDGVDHGSRLISRRGQPSAELMPQGNHVMRQIEAIVLKNRRDARNAIEGIGVLDRDHLPKTTKVRGRVRIKSVQQKKSICLPNKTNRRGRVRI